MKSLIASAALLSLTLAVPALAQSSSGGTGTGSGTSSEATTATNPTTSQTGATGVTGAVSDLKPMLTQLVQDNQNEISMGKLALDNAKSSAVKSFAKKLIADHTAAAEKVRPVAQAQGIDVSSVESMPSTSNPASDEIAQLKALKGSEFDRQFASTMVDDHEKAISLLDRIKTAGAGDPQVTKLVDQLKPTLQKHLTAAKALQKSVGSPRHDTRGTDTGSTTH